MPLASLEPLAPLRVMIVDFAGKPVGLGQLTGRHSLRGKLTTYQVRLDDGTRMDVSPRQLRDAANVVMPPLWRQPGAAANAPSPAARPAFLLNPG